MGQRRGRESGLKRKRLGQKNGKKNGSEKGEGEVVKSKEQQRHWVKEQGGEKARRRERERKLEWEQREQGMEREGAKGCQNVNLLYRLFQQRNCVTMIYLIND